MIGLIIYILGVIIAEIWSFHKFKNLYYQITLNDALLFICICLFSWVTVIILVLIWLNDNGGKIILWRNKD
jgi:hypothetical protein